MTKQQAGPRSGPGPAPDGRPARADRRRKHAAYPYALYLPATVVYLVIFGVPTVMACYFALTRWTLFDSTFVGLQNFRDFLAEQNLRIGFQNTIFYAVVTSGLKVVLGLLLGVLLTSKLRLRGFLRSVVFFPVLVSTVAVGITFSVLLKPDTGLVNRVLAPAGIDGGDWLGDATTALLSVALVDVWKGVGLATAGNVLLFLVVSAIIVPLTWFLGKRQVAV
ncbi:MULTISPECIES: sugar ABC transporter permease [unclassified Nonomuraea]|uniref:carbohydrate ABC transporter permease n=1 Tax=unclassified Nonomuraea TaxID=2593643 RepID=UPI0034097FD0